MSADLALLTATIREAGALALKLLEQGVKQWNKPDGSLVTEADLAIDAFLREKLTGRRPAYGWLSEESPDNAARLIATHTWIIDPIDGTRAFARKGETWCIGASLVETGRPVISCIFHPQIGRLYSAARGHGTFLNGTRLTITNEQSLQDLRIMGTGKLTAQLEPHGLSIVPSRDTPLLARLAMLSSGELEAVVSSGPKHDWDLAPGELLVTEAGGAVTDLHGNLLNYNQPSRQQPGLVAAGPARHKAIRELLEGI
jgi:myo-inositol-1(or 4)-monophosphatase